MTEQHVIVHGNPVDGLSFIGPFPTGSDAMEWGDKHLQDEDWWIAPIEPPKEQDSNGNG